MSPLSSIISDTERREIGSELRSAGFGHYADIIDELVQFATEEIYLVDDLDRALRTYVSADQAMHQTYGSTAVCGGGIGGAALTPHCAHICHNETAHHKELNNYRSAYLTAQEVIRRVRSA